MNKNTKYRFLNTKFDLITCTVKMCGTARVLLFWKACRPTIRMGVGCAGISNFSPFCPLPFPPPRLHSSIPSPIRLRRACASGRSAVATNDCTGLNKRGAVFSRSRERMRSARVDVCPAKLARATFAANTCATMPPMLSPTTWKSDQPRVRTTVYLL